MAEINSVDDYIASFEGELKKRLRNIRKIIVELAPKADEAVSYGLVGYKLNGKPLVYFGGFAKHVGFYATPNGHEAFAREFVTYKQGKGSVQFPLNQELPIELIKKVVQFRMEQVTKKG
ncbi:MAG: DUF1801 domain-containing protein [bacterium]|nr:DUF1801 domain-containing protein [bacterium]